MTVLHETADCDRVRHAARLVRLARMSPNPKPVVIEIVAPPPPEPIQVEHQLVETVPVPAEIKEKPYPRKSRIVDMGHGPELEAPVPSMMHIKTMVAKRYRVSVLDLESHRRTANMVRPRQIGYYLCATMTRRALPAIGRAFGGRDHTTALHGRNKIARLITEDIHLNEEILALKEAILATFNESLGVPPGSTLLQTRKDFPFANAERIAVPEAQVPPPPTDLPHGKSRSEHSGSSA